MSNPYIIQALDTPQSPWPKCTCKIPQWERILDTVICKVCKGRRK